MTIGYKIAVTPADFHQAHALMREEGVPEQSLGFPTVMALEDDEIIGIIGTDIQNDMILAGPLVVKSDRKRIMSAIKMVEMYEMALRAVKISTFIFYVEEGSFLDKMIARYSEYQPYAVQGTKKFFIRRLN
jgi:hypothetical protein